MTGVALGLVLAAGIGYWLGLRRIDAGNGPLLPRGPVIAFFSGIAVVLVALLWPIDPLADRSFAVHMAQHLLLVFVAPPLLALGRPVTVALRASTPKFRTRYLRPFLHSRVLRSLTNPIVGWVLLVTVSFGVHFSSLYDAALTSNLLHGLEHLLWVSVALLYWWPIVGRDPSPRPMPYPARLFSLFMLMPAMSFLGLAIYSAPEPLYPTYAARVQPWGMTVMEDQHTAAILMWLLGNLMLVASILLVAVAWKHDEERKQETIEAREDAAATSSAFPRDPY